MQRQSNRDALFSPGNTSVSPSTAPARNVAGTSTGRHLGGKSSSNGLGLQSQQYCSPSRWRFALLIIVVLCIWWYGVHYMEARWEGRGRGSSDPTTVTPEMEAMYARRYLLDAASQANVTLYKPGSPLGVCIFTADFWGSPTAGGTATAYHLLAQVLASDPNLSVTMLGVTKVMEHCTNGIKLNDALHNNVNFTCLERRHFMPEVVETEPYEAMGKALVAWTREHIDTCDVIHAHEWGGLLVDLATLDSYRQLKPGLRLAIEAHGGHFWSTQGQVQRPLDITSLRIDHGERMTLHLASALISPTHYMTAFLSQRGWRLPAESIVIPNVIPAIESTSNASLAKPVWRLAFFSRLEERKGLKLFVEAVNRLAAENPSDKEPRFEVFFVGAEARIDMRGSADWLKEKTSQWNFPVHIKVNVKRDEALDILSQEGVLLVLCSLIDNMPYVVAEAAVKGIPFLAFDAGGVLEMFDQTTNEDAVILDPSINALHAKIKSTLASKQMKTVQLSDQVTSGKEQWLRWHSNFAASRAELLQKEDRLLASKAVSKQLGGLVIKTIPRDAMSLEVWNSVCLPRGQDDLPLLLIPQGYELLHPEQVNGTMVELLQMGMVNKNGIGALSFGVSVGRNKVAYPTSPTWMLYTGNEDKCHDDIPVLIRREVFCSSYFAEARIFRTYHSWTLAMMLSQAGWSMHTYPEVMFRASNYSSKGHSCLPDRPPTTRALDFNSASNLYADAEEVMVNLHLAPFPKPISSIVDDYPTEQNHKGWQIGYMVPSDPTLRQLSYWPSASGEARDGKWACSPTENSYPSLSHSLMHPCAAGGNNCCGHPTAPIITRFNSFFSAEHAVLIMAYEAWPICGDGTDMEITLTSRGPNGRYRHTFLRQGFEPNDANQPQRQKVEFRFQVHVGDWVDFIVWPRASQDCDGIYLVDMQIWEDDGLGRQHKEEENPATENKEMPALKTASVSEITAGNKDTFVAAEKGVSLKPEEKEPLKVGEQAEAQQMGDLIDQLIDPVESQQPQARRLLAQLPHNGALSGLGKTDIWSSFTQAIEGTSEMLSADMLLEEVKVQQLTPLGDVSDPEASKEERFDRWKQSLALVQ